MIALGSDHGGFELKQKLKAFLDRRGWAYRDYGSYDPQPCDYPDYAKEVCRAITGGECEKGILICGTGVGMSIAANKFSGIRAALCSDCYSAKMTREHNNANVLTLGARVTGQGLAVMIAETFLTTPFPGEERHVRRIGKLEYAESE